MPPEETEAIFHNQINVPSRESPVQILADAVPADVLSQRDALVHVDAGGAVGGPGVAVAHLALAGEGPGLVQADAVVAQRGVVGAFVWNVKKYVTNYLTHAIFYNVTVKVEIKKLTNVLACDSIAAVSLVADASEK